MASSPSMPEKAALGNAGMQAPEVCFWGRGSVNMSLCSLAGRSPCSSPALVPGLDWGGLG